jgi:hypothetical protein
MTFKQMPEFQPFSRAVQRAIDRVEVLHGSGIFYISSKGSSARIRANERNPAMHIVFFGAGEDEASWEALARNEAMGWGVALGGALLALGAAVTAPIWVPAGVVGGGAMAAVGAVAAGVGAGAASYKMGALVGGYQMGNKQAYLDTVGGKGLKTVEFLSDVVGLATGLAGIPGLIKNVKHFNALQKLGTMKPLEVLSKLRPDELADVEAALLHGFRNKTPQMAAFFQRQGIHSEAELLAIMHSLRAGTGAGSKAMTHYVKKHIPMAILNANIRKALQQELFNGAGFGLGVAGSAQYGAVKTGWDESKGLRNGLGSHTGAMANGRPGRVSRETVTLKDGDSALEVWWAIFQNDPTFAH